MANIHVYYGNPTAGGTDGTAASESGAQTSPITAVLDASQAEEVVIPLALRCDSGYTTVGNTVVSLTGTTAAKWSLCATENGTYASTLTISTAIGATNTVFYAKATSASSESAANDTSVSIVVSTKIGAELS